MCGAPSRFRAPPGLTLAEQSPGFGRRGQVSLHKLGEGTALPGGAFRAGEDLAHDLVSRAAGVVVAFQLAVVVVGVGEWARGIGAGAGLDRDTGGLGLRRRNDGAEVAAEHGVTADRDIPEVAEVSGEYRVLQGGQADANA